MKFIPASESSIFTSVFYVFVQLLFRIRFKNIWIHQQYDPDKNSRTVYFLNHTSWWDGLIPLLLNQKRFNQRGRALMELEQMQNYPFFKWLGTFSIDVDDPAHTLKSIHYAVKSMERKNSALFIYPEGGIRPAAAKVSFKPGIGLLHNQLQNVDFVPIGIHIHTIRHNKPELHIWIDKPVERNTDMNRNELTSKCEGQMKTVLEKLFNSAGFDDTPYEKL